MRREGLNASRARTNPGWVSIPQVASHAMKPQHLKLAGALLVTLAAFWIVASPSLVLALPSIRGTYEHSGWALTPYDCLLIIDRTDSVALSWLAGFLVIGVAGVFGGTFLFCRGSTRSVLRGHNTS